MKKIKLSVAALLIAMNMNAQDTLRTFAATDVIVISKIQVIEMINTIEDILEWQEYDKERGETGMGSYEEGWGSAYWLRVMRDDLHKSLSAYGVRQTIIDCENCDEID